MATVNSKNQNWMSTVLDSLRSIFSRRQARLYCFYDMIGTNRISSSNFVGAQDIPLSSVIGSMNASRCQDFDAKFKLLKQHSAARLEGVANAWKTRQLPPISLIQWGDYYFVQDGHHRLSIANANGQATIHANVTAVTLSENGSGQALSPIEL